MVPRSNLPALFMAVVREFPRERLYGARHGQRWTWLSTREVVAAIRETAAGLVARGLRPGDRVGLLAENRPEWMIADLAVLFAAGADVPVYPTLPADQAAFVLRDAGCRFVVVSGPEQSRKLDRVRGGLPDLEAVFSMDGGPDAESLEALRAQGRAQLAADPGLLEERLAGLGPDSLATIIYTSGTTGTPKGVMLTHGNFCANVAGCLTRFAFAQGDVALSFLPLSHVLERMVQYAYLEKGVAVAFVKGPEQLRDALGEVRPNVFLTVPKVLELAAERIHETVAGKRGLARAVARRALGWADAGADALIAGERPAGTAGWRWRLADRLLLSKLRERLGGRLKFLICGGAALAPDLARFFWAAGVPVYEGYGLTETSPVLAVNHPGHVKLGSVGRPLPGVEIRVASDGEVLARGANVMKGYWNRPEETAPSLVDGWLHTGDLGYLDPDGFLFLTGRKKEILVLSTGKNVAPRAVEESLERSPYINRVIAVGDERPSVGVLIVPETDRVLAWAAERQLPTRDLRELLSTAEVRRLYEGEIHRLQERLAAFEKARRFEFLVDPPTEDNGLLTPTQKVRRHEVLRRFGPLVERMYR